MTIEINTEELVANISALYMADMQDGNASAPDGMVVQNIRASLARLKGELARWSYPTWFDISSYDMSLPEIVEFDLALSPRKTPGKEAIADLMHNYLIHASISGVLAQISPEKAAMHDSQASASLQELIKLLHTKLPRV